jgi:hypothetical protein
MNLREAAELAMYALESTGTDPNDPGQTIQYKREEKAIARLRQAIAEAEQPDLARVGEVGVWGEEKNT